MGTLHGGRNRTGVSVGLFGVASWPKLAGNLPPQTAKKVQVEP
jgi:hypothetical protein